nr:SPOR domain-containing protein [Maritimibacter sp. DP1N21-5]
MPAFLQGNGDGAGTNTTATAGRSTRSVERDVEAPEIFQVSDKGLWDGRPSLGGVWVAHEDAQNPERVIIRNEDNQTFVVGVLYRPERQQPGPAFQVSSDAAEALDMLAGSPANMSVTALKREDVVEEEDAPDGASPADAPTAATAAAPTVAAEPLDPIAAATEALDRAEGKPGSATSAATVAAATAGVAAPAPTTPPRANAPSGALSKAFIQIGIFSVEQNANNTAESLRRAGMVPTIKPGKTSGKDFWRVVVGPAGSTTERAQLLKKIKELGFNDAYFVTN